MSENMFDKSKRKDFSENKDKITKELVTEKKSPFIKESVPKKERISITIDDNINEFLTILCDETNISKSETVNIILKEYIESNKYIREIIESNENLQILHEDISK